MDVRAVAGPCDLGYVSVCTGLERACARRAGATVRLVEPPRDVERTSQVNTVRLP